MTLIELLTSSLRTIGVKNPGVTLTAEEVNDAKEILNLMLDAWSAEQLPIYAATISALTMVIGTASYTVGTGGTFNTARPISINNAYVRDSSGYDHPVEIIGPGQYQALSAKALVGRPYYLHYVMTSPLGTMYLYPAPDAAESLYVDSLKPLADLTVNSDAITLPPGYKAALQTNLALVLCAEYRIQPTPLMVASAAATKKAIINLNAASQHEPVNLGYGRHPRTIREML